MIARYVPAKAVTVECEDVMQVHPEFDIEQKVWVTEFGVVARSLRELQQKLPNATIVGYHPNGYYENHRPKYKEGDPIRSTLRTNYNTLNKTAVYNAPEAKPSQEDLRLERARLEYEKINNLPPRRITPKLAVPEDDAGFVDCIVSAARTAGGKMRWTAELDKTLEDCVAQGWYADQIAVVMKMGLTKNAIIGRCHRKKFQLRHKNGRIPRGR